MFQTSESCIKLHAVVVLELLLSEQCPLLQVCVCVCVSTAPGVCVCVCVLEWVKYREHISLLVIPCIIVCKKKKKKKKIITDNGKMLKYREKYR